MASTIILRRRISSIKNTRQITQAQQLVAASKLRRAQEYALRSRDYAELAEELLQRIGGLTEVSRQPLFEQRPVKNRLYILITSNSGLAGAYNANVLKQLTNAVKVDQDSKVASHVIAIGNKGAQFVRRVSEISLDAAYPGFGDHPTANDLRPVLNTIVVQYKTGEVDEVHVLYTKFKSTVNQITQSLQLLPAQPVETVENAATTNISNFEPDVETVIDQVATRLIEAQVWQSLLESIASEHAMRMVAMKNATDNAKDLIDDYTLELNTARQAAITQELAEITGGSGGIERMSKTGKNSTPELVLDRDRGAWVQISDGYGFCGVDPTDWQVSMAYFEGRDTSRLSVASAAGFFMVLGHTRDVHDALAAEGLEEIREEIESASDAGKNYAALGDLSVAVRLPWTTDAEHTCGTEAPHE